MIAFLLLGLSFLQTPSAAPPAIVAELRAIEERLSSTYGSRDCDGWGSLLTDQWTVTHITGNVITKQQAVESCRTGPALTSTYDELAFRSYGDTALVTGRTTASISGPSAQTIVLRFTDVFIRREGKWLVAISHATRVPD